MNDSIKVVSTLAIGLTAHPAMAHNGELHGRPEENAQPQEPETADTDISISDSQPSPAESVVEVSPAATVPINQFSIGFGEILFSAVLIFPWLLITLKKQLHSKPHL